MRVVLGAVGAGLVVAAVLGLFMFLGAELARDAFFDQDVFPCEEDEVLGYAERFGPDKVGCIHIEEF